ncbi:hypothetical protein OG496_12390 [Streptomyces sp. NBC_00988]|uniref:hypothetical protein n=1 Tax=Streptomyces sp. NBC_00988 TaxID=2903704 RepID=UPI00386AE8E2|nr:hypothetical protein OG496_12390 [Streptomyces sp. NBC_00988]
MLDSYSLWGSRIGHGNTQHAMYGELLEFVNLRMETADSCLTLIENEKIADALGLGRSLLEHYLLFILMCRGKKYFQVQDLTNLTEGEFKKRLKAQQEDLAQKQADGSTKCLEVRRYTRGRYLMYVFEGLHSGDEPEFTIPMHFFQHQEFRPEVMRLKDEDYFQYYEDPEDVKKALKAHTREAEFRYKYYLSYGALLECLELNGLADAGDITRIEAHYTFLGKFLHPTHDAVRELHENSNVHHGGTGVGLSQVYSRESKLLTAVYVCFMVHGLLNEAQGVLEAAPVKYVTKAGTEDLRAITNVVESQIPYFWFIFNGPTAYDKFQFCVSHATQENREEWGDYLNAPSEKAVFNQSILGHFKDTLRGWSNRLWGSYASPLA